MVEGWNNTTRFRFLSAARLKTRRFHGGLGSKHIERKFCTPIELC